MVPFFSRMKASKGFPLQTKASGSGASVVAGVVAAVVATVVAAVVGTVVVSAVSGIAGTFSVGGTIRDTDVTVMSGFL